MMTNQQLETYIFKLCNIFILGMVKTKNTQITLQFSTFQHVLHTNALLRQ